RARFFPFKDVNAFPKRSGGSGIPTAGFSQGDEGAGFLPLPSRALCHHAPGRHGGGRDQGGGSPHRRSGPPFAPPCRGNGSALSSPEPEQAEPGDRREDGGGTRDPSSPDTEGGRGGGELPAGRDGPVRPGCGDAPQDPSRPDLLFP